MGGYIYLFRKSGQLDCSGTPATSARSQCAGGKPAARNRRPGACNSTSTTWGLKPGAPTPEATTQGPTTQRPTTQRPTTQRPTTQRPTTQGPTTRRPTTQERQLEVKNSGQQITPHNALLGNPRQTTRASPCERPEATHVVRTMWSEPCGANR
jgi:hypothetical protein